MFYFLFFFFSVTATLGAIATGTILGWSSPAQVMFESGAAHTPFAVTDKDVQTFSSVFGIGATVGAVPAGYVSGAFGCQAAMMLSEAFLLVGWVMLVAPAYPWMLSAGRVMQGVGVGALCAVIPSYVGEISESRLRGNRNDIGDGVVLRTRPVRTVFFFFFIQNAIFRPSKSRRVNFDFRFSFYRKEKKKLRILKLIKC